VSGGRRQTLFSGDDPLDDPQRSLPTLNILWFCDSTTQQHASLQSHAELPLPYRHRRHQAMRWPDQFPPVQFSLQASNAQKQHGYELTLSFATPRCSGLMGKITNPPFTSTQKQAAVGDGRTGQPREQARTACPGAAGRKGARTETSFGVKSLKAFPFAKFLCLLYFLKLKWKNRNKQTLNSKF